jgi:hypothetical protein
VVDRYWRSVSASLVAAGTQVLFDKRRDAPSRAGMTTHALIPENAR